MGKKSLILGATGMVGSLVLNELLLDTEVENVVSIGRKHTGIDNDKLTEVIHSNFLDFSTISGKLNDFDICFYCLGVYQNQVSKKQFFEITCDYQKALTDVLERTSPNLTFVLFGAQGADTSEKSSTTFAKAKGRAENLLSNSIFPRKFIFRPGYIHPTGSKRPSGVLYKLMLPIAGIIFKMIPSIGITDLELAKAMVIQSKRQADDSRVFENREIKAY